MRAFGCLRVSGCFNVFLLLLSNKCFGAPLYEAHIVPVAPVEICLPAHAQHNVNVNVLKSVSCQWTL